MNSKFIGIMVIGLVLSLSFVPSILARPTDELNNSTDLNNTELNSTNNLTNNDNILEVKLTGNIPYVNSPSSIGGDLINEPWMKEPVWGNSEMWKSFSKWFDGKSKDKWYNAWHFWYYIAKGCAAIVESLWFIVQMVGWFFVCIAWVFYAIPMILINLDKLFEGIYLMFWCFGSYYHFKDKDVTRTIKLNNSTIAINNTVEDKTVVKGSLLNGTSNNGTFLNGDLNNKQLNIKNNNTTSVISLFNTTLTNCTFEWMTFLNTNLITNEVVNATLVNGSLLNGTLLNNETNEFNLTNVLLKNHYSSLSGSSYENVTDKQLNNAKNNINKEDKAVKKSLSIINSIFGGIDNALTVIDLVVNIVTGVSASLSAPTSGGSVPAAVGTQTAKFGVKEIVKTVFEKIIKDIVLDTVITSLTSISSSDDKLFKFMKLLNDKCNDFSEFNEGSKFDKGKSIFSLIKDIINTISSISEMIWDFNKENVIEPLQTELNYRSNW